MNARLIAVPRPSHRFARARATVRGAAASRPGYRGTSTSGRLAAAAASLIVSLVLGAVVVGSFELEDASGQASATAGLVAGHPAGRALA